MRTSSNIAIVALEGDLDVRTAPAVRRRIDRLIAGGCHRIFLNMASVRYVDSAGMGLILTELRRMRGMDGLLSLTNVSSRVYQALCRLRMVDYMPVSRSGESREVSALDPSVLPQWRTTFRVDASALVEARGRVESLLSSLPFSPDGVFDMTLASGEALGNAVDHTRGDGVLVTVAAYPDRVTIDVADRGAGIEVAPDDELPETDASSERGRGIRLMRLLADAVTIAPKQAGEGTVVRLVKLFDVPGAAGCGCGAAQHVPA